MYVELTCKSNFSFLRGASDSRDYIRKASALGMPALGIADINGVYGLPRAFEMIRDQAPDLKLICGAEITMQDHPPMTLIATTRPAWGVLCRLITKVHSGKLKGEGYLSFFELNYFMRNFPAAQNLICILQNDLKNNFPILKNLFQGNLYVSLCRYLDGLDRKRTDQALDIVRRHGLHLVASNDVHYADPEKRFLQDCLTCIREGTILDKAGFKLFGNAERYLKSPTEMQRLFSDLPEAIFNTLKIANRCTFSLSDLKYTYPKEAVPEGESSLSYLRKLVLAGARQAYKGQLSAAVMKQIDKELAFFAKRGEEDYFLTMHDILKEAQSKKIVYQGRGSAASSIVCYALGITAIDPISQNLLFDRFANDARKDPPDIDVDFEHERREEVIQGIYARYGRDRAGMVAAVHTYKTAGAYREICKVLGVEVGTLKAAVVRARFQELAKDYAKREVMIEPLMNDIANFPRHIGTHSGGFVITNEPLIETVPIEPTAMNGQTRNGAAIGRTIGRTIVQWDKHDLETLGMMKIDILSIGFLTAIRKTTNMVGINWKDIPQGDPKTYRLIQSAQTAGCFQIESRAQMNSLPHTKPAAPYELTIQVALIRPSMSVGGMSRAYLKGRALAKRGIHFNSGNSKMNAILGRTHGVAMFPDQIMQIAMDVCGMTSTDADKLRRALGQERSAGTLESEGIKLYNAMLKAGIKEPLAQDILKRTSGFASYGFPEAHAASYGALAYKSVYLKAHYPAEFLCALINSQPMGFYRIDFLINEAKRNSGVQVLPAHPLNSDWDAKMEGVKTIRMGFRDIAKARKETVVDMMNERHKKPFDSIEDFIARTDFDKAVLNNLTIAGAFECYGVDRRHSFWKSLEFKNLMGKKREGLQFSFFDENYRVEDQPLVFDKMTELEEAIIDYRTQGYSLKGSLMQQLRLEVPHLPPTNSKIIKTLKNKSLISCAGIILADQRPPPAKGFGFITLEDEFGTIDLVLRPDIYDKYKTTFRSSRFLIVQGEIQRLGDHITIKAEHIESFSHIEKVRSHQPHPRMLDKLDW